ncbi:MAG: DNA translocase FtsK [Clostridiales bacterium]|nr:DNA translocase FtsK [Candidatus Coliplasma caballi]
MAEKKKSNAKKTSSPKGKTYTAKRTPELKKDKKQTKDTPFVRFLLAFFAVFIVITFFPQIDSGALGAVRDLLRGLFGFGYYLVPVFLFLWVTFWKRDVENAVFGYKTLLLWGGFLFTLGIVHLIAVHHTSPEEYGAAVKSFDHLYENGKALAGGGVIGGGFGALIAIAVGWVATTILCSVGVFVCGVLYCGSTPAATLRAIRGWFVGVTEKAAEEPEELPAKAKKAKAEPTEELRPAKHKLASVLVDDKEITDDVVATEQNGQRRFILPAEEQEEVFAHVTRKKKEELLPEEPAQTGIPDYEPEITREEAPVIPEIPVVTVQTESAEEEPLQIVEESEELPVEDDASEPVIKEPSTAEEVLKELAEDDVESEPLDVPAEVKAPYVFPPISLLAQDQSDTPRPTQADVNAVSRKLETVLESFKVKAKVIGASFGPTVTRYEVQPETGVRVKQIANLSDDIALHLAATSVRIENIPGKSAIGIEIPNRSSATVRLRNLIEATAFHDSKSRLITALGEDVSGSPVYLDIGKMPHLLIAGATGMGKSVCMNSLIVSLLYHASPDEVKFIMIDPKKVEMADYNGIPHLLVPVINDAKKAAGTLNWACVEMEKRYELIQEVNAKNLNEYNAIVKDDPEREAVPYIVIFIDELADLMMTAPDDVETSICRLAQKARAAGIHLVIGTQRPSVDVITGLIKANIPSRTAFTVASQVDSRTILDMAGAEKLLGRGDMLYYPVGAMKPQRVQGAFVDGKSEVVAVTQFIKQASASTYDQSIIDQIEKEARLCGAPKHGHKSDGEEGGSEEIRLDDKFYDALELAIDAKNVSTSMLQTRLGLGYARAARIVGVMEQKGYIGAYDTTTKTRRIIITKEELLELKMGKSENDDEE